MTRARLSLRLALTGLATCAGLTFIAWLMTSMGVRGALAGLVLVGLPVIWLGERARERAAEAKPETQNEGAQA